MLVIVTRYIWQQSSAVQTPHKFSACFLAIQTNKLYGKPVITTNGKKKKWGGKKMHSTSIFLTLESFETEHYFF